MPRQRSTTPAAELFWSKVDRTGGPGACWLWVRGKDSDGYGIFSEPQPLGAPRSQRHVRAHRYAWALAHGPVPEGKLLMHSCDVRACVNPAHLSVGTPLENNRDAFAKGRRKAAGEHNIKAKLTAYDVLVIRSSSECVRALAARYGINTSTVYSIRKGKTWTHVSTTNEREAA